jgi:hypothetical protein
MDDEPLHLTVPKTESCPYVLGICEEFVSFIGKVTNTMYINLNVLKMA